MKTFPHSGPFSGSEGALKVQKLSPWSILYLVPGCPESVMKWSRDSYLSEQSEWLVGSPAVHHPARVSLSFAQCWRLPQVKLKSTPSCVGASPCWGHPVPGVSWMWPAGWTHTATQSQGSETRGGGTRGSLSCVSKRKKEKSEKPPEVSTATTSGSLGESVTECGHLSPGERAPQSARPSARAACTRRRHLSLKMSPLLSVSCPPGDTRDGCALSSAVHPSVWRCGLGACGSAARAELGVYKVAVELVSEAGFPPAR